MRRRQDFHFIEVRTSCVCAEYRVGIFTVENTGWCSSDVHSRYSPANSYTYATSVVCAYAQKTGFPFYRGSNFVRMRRRLGRYVHARKHLLVRLLWSVLAIVRVIQNRHAHMHETLK